jgi:tripartite-type tricarboxylate transporter receptor subunit TctC
MTTFHSIRAAAAILAAALVLPAAGAGAADGDFLRGKRVSLLIGGGSGGGVDVSGRLFARHVVRHLPGAPTIVAQNHPAGGGIIVYQTLANVAPRDGTAFATFASGPLTLPLLRDQNVNYDVRKFTWLGRMSDDANACHTMAGSKVRTVEDAQKIAINVGATGVTARTATTPLMLNAAIGTKFRVIAGYKGTEGVLLALERGEVEGRCVSFSSIHVTRPDWIPQKKINLLFQTGLTKHRQYPDLPLASELAKAPESRKLLEFLGQTLAVTNPFALPPEVAADRTALWRKAFDDTVRDPAFLAEAKKLRLNVDPAPGLVVEHLVNAIYATPPDILAIAKASIAKGKAKKKAKKKKKEN